LARFICGDHAPCKVPEETAAKGIRFSPDDPGIRLASIRVAMNVVPMMLDREPVPTEPAARPPWNWRAMVRSLLVILAALAAWFWGQCAERRALLALPPAERQAVYQRELANFERICTTNPPDSLADECRHRAWVLSWLPECDAGCRSTIGRVIPLHDDGP